MSFAPRTPSSPPYESTGGRLVSIDGRALPLIGASLAADAKAGVVRITLEQTFRNPHDEPLRVTYSLPLPADGAVSGFAFRIGDERVVGQVDSKQRARQRFEEAILEGKTAAILDQERSSLFTQEVGNVPPRTQVVCEVQIDQKLAWLPDGAWEWRFPTVVAPRYLGGEGRVADHSKITVDVAEGELPVKLALSLAIRDQLPEQVRPESPSHALHSGRGLGRTDVTFGDERGAGLDRDVVVRWRVAQLKIGTELDVSRPAAGVISEHAYGLLTLVPPAVEAKTAALPRDLIVLLDTSGSMSGSPLDQARRVTAALVDSLTDQDQLELIEFSNSPRRWKHGAVAATEANRRDAQAWLARLRASGGTEMRTGILEALAPLRLESQRQVILITDGQIGFEHEVLNAIAAKLPRGSRVHTVGVGSGVNRSLTMPAARAGRGVELVIGLGEDAERFVQRLLARTHAPLLTDVEVSGSAVVGVAPQRIPDLFGGSPALVSLQLRPEGGEVIIRSRSADGEVEDRLQVRPTAHGEGSAAVATLFAREVVEDLELNVAIGRNKAELDPQIERLGIDFQISTRLTSWVAVSAAHHRRPARPEAPRDDASGARLRAVGGRRGAAAGGQRGARRGRDHGQEDCRRAAARPPGPEDGSAGRPDAGGGGLGRRRRRGPGVGRTLRPRRSVPPAGRACSRRPAPASFGAGREEEGEREPARPGPPPGEPGEARFAAREHGRARARRQGPRAHPAAQRQAPPAGQEAGDRVGSHLAHRLEPGRRGAPRAERRHLHQGVSGVGHDHRHGPVRPGPGAHPGAGGGRAGRRARHRAPGQRQRGARDRPVR